MCYNIIKIKQEIIKNERMIFMKLNEEFTVKVNKYGKKTFEYIRAIKYEKTLSEIIITTISGNVLKYDRTEYKSRRLYED